MSADKKVILEELRMLDFVWVHKPIRKWFGGKIIGWNLTASSLLRKSFTLKRLEEEIKERNLPLEIKDEPNMSNSFQVYLKQVA